MNTSSQTDDRAGRIDIALAHAMGGLWPRRRHQECFLDLAEQKAWGDTQRADALAVVARWLASELHLSNVPSGECLRSTPAGEPGDGAEVGALRLLFERELRAGAASHNPAVARWISRLSPAVGASPKTLANSLSTGMRSDRLDHRWLRALARILRGGGQPEGWLYHRRHPRSVDEVLARAARQAPLDAGDATVWLSLLALWQRRRPTPLVRANRGQVTARRQTPKPIARMCGHLILPSQLKGLVDLARELSAPAAHNLVALAIEAALTEAHLAPHPARRGGEVAPAMAGEDLLRAAELALATATGLLGEEDREVFAFRIERMRAWRDGRPVSPAAWPTVRLPYLVASMAVEPGAESDRHVNRPFNPYAPGLLMLLPQLRRRNLLETE